MRDGLDIALKDDLALKVMKHRNDFYSWYQRRYMEILMNLRDYVNTPKSINKYKLEWYLRQGYDVILGRNALDIDCIMGVVKNNFTTTDPMNPYATNTLDRNAIQWLVKKSMIPVDDFDEITYDDDATTGRFVVLRNKSVRYTNDFEIINFYADRLAEIQASRYSLILQAKVSKFIQGEIDNETVDQIITKVYNGQPYITTSPGFSPNFDVIDLQNQNTVDLIKELKQAYNDEVGELNNTLGINSTGIDKASGVSEDEVQSNNEVVESNANMYVNGVQMGLDLYNKRFGTKYQCYINRKPVSDNENNN